MKEKFWWKIRRKTKQALKYFFARRLAITTLSSGSDKKLFRWQQMPKGYRWF